MPCLMLTTPNSEDGEQPLCSHGLERAESCFYLDLSCGLCLTSIQKTKACLFQTSLGMMMAVCPSVGQCMIIWRCTALFVALGFLLPVEAGDTIYRCQKNGLPLFQDFPCNGRPPARTRNGSSGKGAAAAIGSDGNSRCLEALRKLQRHLLQSRDQDAAGLPAQQATALTSRLRDDVEAACR